MHFDPKWLVHEPAQVKVEDSQLQLEDKLQAASAGFESRDMLDIVSSKPAISIATDSECLLLFKGTTPAPG